MLRESCPETSSCSMPILDALPVWQSHLFTLWLCNACWWLSWLWEHSACLVIYLTSWRWWKKEKANVRKGLTTQFRCTLLNFERSGKLSTTTKHLTSQIAVRPRDKRREGGDLEQSFISHMIGEVGETLGEEVHFLYGTIKIYWKVCGTGLLT